MAVLGNTTSLYCRAVGHNTKMKIEHPERFNIRQLENDFLWKYLDIFKLLDFITTGKIYFTRFYQFEDGLEGLTGKAVNLMETTQGKPFTFETMNKSFTTEEKKE
jgi:hypothetical protein